MSRTRTYQTAAERQKAYRARVASRLAATNATSPAKRRRALSRPARLAALVRAMRALQQEYQDWLDSLPEVFEDGDMAERLRETLEQIETAVDLMAEIQPPLGYGRD